MKQITILKKIKNKIINPYKFLVAVATTKVQLKEATLILLNNNIKYRVFANYTGVCGIDLAAPEYVICVAEEDVDKAQKLILNGG